MVHRSASSSPSSSSLLVPFSHSLLPSIATLPATLLTSLTALSADTTPRPTQRTRSAPVLLLPSVLLHSSKQEKKREEGRTARRNISPSAPLRTLAVLRSRTRSGGAEKEQDGGRGRSRRAVFLIVVFRQLAWEKAERGGMDGLGTERLAWKSGYRRQEGV
jgi:hypothetical protein